jgi:hypothetical protein
LLRAGIEAAPSRSPWLGRGLAVAAFVAIAVLGWQASRPAAPAPPSPPAVEAPAVAPRDAVDEAPVVAPRDAVDVAPRREVPAATAQVKLEVTGTPPGTTVIGPDERVLGTTPDAIVLPAGSVPLELTFERPDGRRQSRPVVPERDQTIALEWPTPDRARGKGKRGLHHDLETPFGK